MAHILLIENNWKIREYTCELLECHGYKVTTAQNGKKGVAIAKALIPSIVICCIDMPECNGYEVLKQLKQDPATNDIHFILSSEKVNEREMEKALSIGACDYLYKPFVTADLLRSVYKCLDKVSPVN
jgi:CheY-like chemotaxis protein